MGVLLISTFCEEDVKTAAMWKEIKALGNEPELICTGKMKISHCIGCNDCWIKTPGLCCIKDDYEGILIKMLTADKVIFFTETSLGFVCSRMKNLIDRILPLATMHLKFKDGQMRHYSRYNRQPDMGLVYTGSADSQYLNDWMERVQVNLHGKSLGAFPYSDREELYHAFAHH